MAFLGVVKLSKHQTMKIKRGGSTFAPTTVLRRARWHVNFGSYLPSFDKLVCETVQTGLRLNRKSGMLTGELSS